MLQKSLPIIAILLLVAFVVSLFQSPAITSWISMLLVLASLGLACLLILHRHHTSCKRGGLTRAQFLRNLLLDLLGLLLAIAAASYLGGFAGMRMGESHGGWAGLIAGMAVAFLAAWGTRRVWGRAVGNLMGWPAG